MHQESSFVKQPDRNFTNLLNFLINPNSFLLKKEAGYLQLKQDIRSSSEFKIVGRKVIYLLRTIFLVVIDNLAIVMGWLAIEEISHISQYEGFIFSASQLSNSACLFVLLTINLAIFFASGMYSTKDRSRRIGDALAAYCLSHVAFVSTLYFLADRPSISSHLVMVILSVWLVNLWLICLARFVVFQGIYQIRNCSVPLRRKVFLIGVREDIIKCQKLFAHSKSFNIVETLDLSFTREDIFIDRTYNKFLSREIDEIFICSWEKVKEQTKIFWALQTSGISWRILPIKQAIPQKNPELADIEGIPTIRYSTSAIVGIDFLLKRFFDLLVAVVLLIVLAVPMLIIALLIKLNSPGKIFYRQSRVGLKGEIFQVWKFRTMVANASELQKTLEAKNEVLGGILFKITDDPRVTSVGKFLRRYSLDELPQLFNVLRGEMSLVGPRPLPTRDVAKFGEQHHFRHEIMPGITGLWQVSGRSDTSSEQVFTLDFQYIQNWSLFLDIKILLKTVRVVLFSKGAY